MLKSGFRYLATCLGLLVLSIGVAQPIPLDDEGKKHYRKITQTARKVPNSLSQTTYHLAQALTTEHASALEKVRSVYVWMTHNIAYDMRSFESGNYPDYRPRAVLSKREALCSGYASLFAALCAEVDVRCEIINGFSKGYGYEPGSTFEVINHAWNAVEIDNHWYLIDATWGATSSNNTFEKKPMREEYFMPDPVQFLQDHLPEIEAWQLVNNPISLQEFEAGAMAINNALEQPGNYNYEDSLQELLNLDASMLKIEYQKRVSLVNPNNSSADYKIGVEFLYRGLDSLELINQLEAVDIEQEIPRLESSIFDLFSEAAFHFSGLKPSSPYFESGQHLLDETIFQKGIFKYEIAHRLIDLYGDFDSDSKKRLFNNYETLVNQHFDQALFYFEQIPIESRYYDDATEYKTEYLNKRFAEL